MRAALLMIAALGAGSLAAGAYHRIYFGPWPVEARGDGFTVEGSFAHVDVEAVSRIAGHDGNVVIDGYVFADWDPRPEKMVPAVRRYPLPRSLRWHEEDSARWRYGPDIGVLTHVPSGRRIAIENLPYGPQGPQLAATALDPTTHLIVLAAGDLKMGPSSYWAWLVVRSDVLAMPNVPRDTYPVRPALQ
jgi:hypothetical protein